MGITKNKQTEAVIRQMAAVALPDKKVKSVTELTEGMCNAAYLVEFSDASKSVLKIAPGNGNGLMSNEVGLMDAEVKAMRMVKKDGAVKVAEVQYYDTSREICDGSYFFMEALEGESYFSVRECYTTEENRAVNYEIGQLERKITSISGERFGLLGDTGHQYDTLFEFLYALISNVLSDAKKKNVNLGVSADEVLTRLEQEKELFTEVTQPVLVHWDMWEGNIFVKDKHVCGVIDWERALWGEAFMDDRFRRHTRNADFLKGYGKEAFSLKEKKRILWYDIYLYLTMMTEGAYREYEDDEQYRWVRPLFEESWNECLL